MSLLLGKKISLGLVLLAGELQKFILAVAVPWPSCLMYGMPYATSCLTPVNAHHESRVLYVAVSTLSPFAE
jgi:hypothetical protein